jgi:signal transduction histidine kinase
VGQLAHAFNRMAESLEKIQNLRRNLMIDVAHELRTPLTNIRGYLEALKDGVLPPSSGTFSMLQDETLRWSSSRRMLQPPGPMRPARPAVEPTDLPAEINTALGPFPLLYPKTSRGSSPGGPG